MREIDVDGSDLPYDTHAASIARLSRTWDLLEATIGAVTAKASNDVFLMGSVSALEKRKDDLLETIPYDPDGPDPDDLSAEILSLANAFMAWLP